MHPDVKAIIEHNKFKALPVEETLYMETYQIRLIENKVWSSLKVDTDQYSSHCETSGLC